MSEPIAPETLAKIRRHDEIDLRAAEKPDGALDETAWERHVLLAEVDRLKAEAKVLDGQLQSSTYVVRNLARVVDVVALEIRRAVRMANAGDLAAAIQVITDFADEADWLDNLDDDDNFDRPSAPTVEQQAEMYRLAAGGEV